MRRTISSGSEPARQDRGPVKARVVRRTIIVAAAIVLVVGTIAGVAIYDDRVKPFRTTVLEVDGTSIKMDYFLKRVAISGQQPVNVLQMLAREEMLKEETPKPPYNISVTAQEIDQYARTLARGKDATIGESEYKEWYRQQLNESRLTDAEFRELLRTSLLTQKMSDYLGARVPTVADQVFVNMIAVKDSNIGAEVKKKYEAGQDFASLAKEYSTDPQLKQNGGRVGWFPRGVLQAGLDSVAFELKILEPSEPIYIDEQTTILLMVSAKSSARQIDELSLQALKSKALDSWYQDEYPKYTIAFKGFRRGFDSETEAWVQRQMLKMGVQLTQSVPSQ